MSSTGIRIYTYGDESLLIFYRKTIYMTSSFSLNHKHYSKLLYIDKYLEINRRKH